MQSFCILVFGIASAIAVDVSLVTFDGSKATTFNFVELNDPVMGGRSTGTWHVDSAGHFGVMDGEVVDVPSLKAPGFIKAAADGSFPDVSATADGALVLRVRSSTPDYKGFRVSFASGTLSARYACAGGGSIPLSRGCFKAKFAVPAGSEFSEVRIPFSSFSDKWSPATGEQTTTCAQDKSVCPTAEKLKGITRVEFWAEGAGGKIQLEVQSVSADDATSHPTTSVLMPLLKAAEADEYLISFDGHPGTSFNFFELNDPVMGGKSSGTWRVDSQGQFGIMDGEVVDVPSLKAPGFIKAAAKGSFPDLSSAINGALVLKVRSSTPEYRGFRITMASGTLSPAYACSGGGSMPLSRGCFKAKFSVPAGTEFTEVRIPFNSFSDKWSPYTGEQTTTCAQDKSVCLTTHELSAIKRVEFWAEGVNGKVHLEIQSVFTQLSVLSSVPAPYNTCSSPVQSNLRYGVSGRTTAIGLPITVDTAESLAEAVCCDHRAQAIAEPQFIYEAPDISLFSKLEAGVTTFYDSACGLPVFRAPVNRTMAEFKADTEEHGYPSFREGEVVLENLRYDHTTGGYVTSKCGTHLGTYLPDAKGARWCIDTVCIAGNPSASQTLVV